MMCQLFSKRYTIESVCQNVINHRNFIQNAIYLLYKPFILLEMAGNVGHRAYSPIIQMLRTVLLGRKANNPLRFVDECAPRPGPEANLPPGPSHKLSGNYYYTRDARREVHLPTSIADATKTKAITAGAEDSAAIADTTASVVASVKSKTPGALFKYSQ